MFFGMGESQLKASVLYASAGGIYKFTPDGTKTTFYSTDIGASALAFAVPEPTTYALTFLGLGVMLIALRKPRSLG